MKPVSSWGRLDSPLHDVTAFASRADVASGLAAAQGPGIAYGMGRSYGDQCLNPRGVLWETRHLDRFIAFDESSGLLSCEAGVLLSDIQRTFMPRGWGLPVTPGTLQVTVGGAIANDVHGKNHHIHGSFGHHVAGLTLARTDGRTLECAQEREPDWFAATVGGMGLTGVVTQATLRLHRVPGPWLETQTQAFTGVEEFFQLADRAEAEWEHTVAWFDCLAPQGRGLFFRGRPISFAGAWQPRSKHAMPLQPPVSLVNRLTLRAFNSVYFRATKAKAARRIQHHSAFLYPLDDVLQWNRLYGPRGFYQYQAVFPHAQRMESIRDVLAAIRRSGEGSFLAVLKTFGTRPAAGMLGFPMHGVTFALDFANSGGRTHALFRELDAIVASAGGRIYAAKDARMPRALFESGYPRVRDFIPFRDPGISSAMSRRLFGS